MCPSQCNGSYSVGGQLLLNSRRQAVLKIKTTCHVVLLLVYGSRFVYLVRMDDPRASRMGSGEVGLQRCNYRYTGLDTWHLIIPELEIAQNRRSARAAGYRICGRLIVSFLKLYSVTRQLPSV